MAYGAATQDDPRVLEAVERVCTAGRAHGRPVGMFVARVQDVPHWASLGATLFLLSSDHNFMLAGAAALAEAARA